MKSKLEISMEPLYGTQFVGMLIISVIATADLVEVKLVKQLIRTGQLCLLKEKKDLKLITKTSR